MTLHAHATARDESLVILDNTEHGVLYVISRNPAATLRTLRDLCGIDVRPLRRILQRLQSAGLITRTSATDHAAITITEPGHSALRADG